MSYALIHINSATRAASDVAAGYSDEFLISEMGTFATIAVPTPSSTPGSSKLVSTAHTFGAGDGYTELRGKMGSTGADGESVGESGGGVMKYNPKVTVVGDGPVQCEYIENLLNKEVMILAGAPDCNSTKPYAQYGGKCSVCIITKVTFKSGAKLSGGLKEYELTFETYEKNFYTATITKKS
jgi:hypothetical protein